MPNIKAIGDPLPSYRTTKNVQPTDTYTDILLETYIFGRQIYFKLYYISIKKMTKFHNCILTPIECFT